VTGVRTPAVEREVPVAGVVAVVALVVLAVSRQQLAGLFDSGTSLEWMTVFIAVAVQATPFLVLGVVVSGLVSAFLSPTWLARVLPRNPVVSVVGAGAAGLGMPGCECGAVPIAGRLIRGGVPAAAALTFLLAAPAINPIVLVATATAFPGQPELVAARFGASLATALVMGLIWLRIGNDRAFEHLVRRLGSHDPQKNRWFTFSESASHDLLHAGGWLIAGAAVAASVQVLVPSTIIEGLAAFAPVAILTLAVAAFVIAVCSEADAFIATSFIGFSPTAKLAFMVVGPAVDIKLVALQYGTFGPRFTKVFAPLTFAVALGCTVVAGWVLL
jgi:uncharacterized membrane protein YraQ (UPF0718 family)